MKEYAKVKGKLEDLVDDLTSKKRRHKKMKRKQARGGCMLRVIALLDCCALAVSSTVG